MPQLQSSDAATGCPTPATPVDEVLRGTRLFPRIRPSHDFVAMAGRQKWTGDSLEDDFFEVPAELLSEWIRNPGVLAGFARHYQTGQPFQANSWTACCAPSIRAKF